MRWEQSTPRVWARAGRPVPRPAPSSRVQLQLVGESWNLQSMERRGVTPVFARRVYRLDGAMRANCLRARRYWLSGAHRRGAVTVSVRGSGREERADDGMGAFGERGALRLKQRRDEERMIGELDAPCGAVIIDAAHAQTGVREATSLLHVEPVVAVVLLDGRVTPIDGVEPRAAGEVHASVHVDEPARERADQRMRGVRVRLRVIGLR